MSKLERIKAELFLKAKKAAYKIWADCGSDIGILQTSAQVIVHYSDFWLC